MSIPEFSDEHCLTCLAWLVHSVEAEWQWAVTWDDGMLGPSGHNWWVTTFTGFYKAGLYFPEFRGWDRWRALAPTWMEREIKLLIRPDGFTVERSGYSHGMHNVFAGLAKLATMNGCVFSKEYYERIEAGKDAAWKMKTTNGIPHFGDGFSAYAPDAPGAAEEIDHPAHIPVDTCLPISGYYIMREAWRKDADCLSIDAGPRGAAGDSHDHTAVFDIELLSRGRPMLIDNGSGPYGDSPERMWRVGSSAHNVLTVDGRDHLDLKSDFSWHGELTPVIDDWVTDPDFVYFSGVHEAYKRLEPTVPAVRRKIFRLRGGYWILMDRIDRAWFEGEHEYTQHFHVRVENEMDGEGRLVTSGEGGNLMIVPVPGSSGVGAKEPCPHPIGGYDNPDHITYTLKTTESATLVDLLVPFDGDDRPDVEVELAEIACDMRTLSPFEATGLRIRIDGREDVFFDQHMHWNLPWRIGEHSGEGRLYHSRCASLR